ncbi:MAG: DNA recombination protein RmuC [Candidatus Gastranaerophilaceae bacterium]
MILNILCFSIGAIISGIIVKLYADKKSQEEVIRIKTKLETFESLQKLIKDDFSEIARNTIKSEQEDLRKQHQEALDLKLAPLAKELGEFKAKVEHFNTTGEKNTAALIEKITNLEKSSAEITKEANQLANALTSNQNIKGAYGETLLDTILQSCGMQEGLHYTKQFVSKSISEDETTHTIRPDVVLNLPNNRHLIIDSKMTLTSYLEYMQNEEMLPKFKAEVKKRIMDLSDKNYQGAGNLYQPDFVLMYVPIENSVQILYEDADLINRAYKANVIIVGTSSLLTTVRLVNQLMAQQKQQESVMNIVQAGTNLYETFSKFCEDLLDVKKKFEALNSQFNKTINRFQRGNKHNPSLFSQVEALKDYGITTTKKIPQELLEELADENNTVEEISV